MKISIKFLQVLTITTLMPCAPLVFAQEADVGCYSHKEASYQLAEAAVKGVKAVAALEQSIMQTCSKSFNNVDLSLANAEAAKLAFSAQKAPKIIIKNTGSVWYEGLDSCGYHPQRREGSCSLAVKQRYGFGGTPNSGPGSWEYVAFCVYGLPANPAGWTLQNISAVHVHDEAFGKSPYWYFTVTDQAETRLHTTPVDGKTYLAKSILSWGIKPQGCNHDPIWGNEAYYQVRLDP